MGYALGYLSFTSMDCTYCQGNKATCHLTKVVNGHVVEAHVCEKCIPELAQPNVVDFDIWNAVAKLAAKKGQPDLFKSIEPEPIEISVKSLLIRPDLEESVKCPACGFTSDDLRKVGRLGCPNCYAVFADLLQDVFNDCQKGFIHIGKTPLRLLEARRHLLEEELQQAVADERFEEAAALKEKLRRLDAKPKKRSPNNKKNSNKDKNS